VNGGRNYNGDPGYWMAVAKSGYMLEQLVYVAVPKGDNP